MKKEKVLARAQECLIKYSNSTSKYYNELKKNYNEYKKQDSVDPVTNKLYENQILKLVRYVEEKENFAFMVVSLISMIIVIILLVSYITVKLLNTNDEVKVIIEKANSEVDLHVGENTDYFKFGYHTDEDIINTEPIAIEVTSFSKDNYNIIYDIYLKTIETSANINNIKYSVTVDGVTHIHSLKDTIKVLDRYNLYSNSMKLNESKRIYIRFYTTDINDDVSVFNYSFDYDGYLE